MSYIPNVREKRHFNFKTGRYDGKENGYRQEYLSDADKEFVCGFDWVTETVIDSFFQNLDIYREEFLEAEINIDRINLQAVVADDMTEEEINALDDRTRLLGLIHDCLLDYIERDRNGLVVSMLDGMDKKEYEANKAKVLAKENEG